MIRPSRGAESPPPPLAPAADVKRAGKIFGTTMPDQARPPVSTSRHAAASRSTVFYLDKIDDLESRIWTPLLEESGQHSAVSLILFFTKARVQRSAAR
jgi:hypothetical protein